MTITFGNRVLGIDGDDLPDRSLIGSKAWSLGRMSALGLNVPPAFVVTSRACSDYLANEASLASIEEEIAAGIGWLERRTGCTYGGGPRPLLVSIRSGAAVSMPGMMDTVLNVGISDATEKLLAEQCQSPEFARDTHRRFLEVYANVVLNLPVIDLAHGHTPARWREVIEQAGAPVPESVWKQLHGTVGAVFRSWNSRRAKRFRLHHGISDDLGTAVLVQAMVFGNRDRRSGSGVLFSRNPLSGEPTPYGEFLLQAQGEDVVSGKVTPQPLESMRDILGDALDELLSAARLLERADRDLQDIEFTVESGELFLLQARIGKRAPEAAARIAVDMVAERLITRETALKRVSPEQIRSLLRPRLAKEAAAASEVLFDGEGASPGIGWGVVVSDPDEAERRAGAGEDVVLARATTSPNDLHGMIAARAIITERGGTTSHAAVVGRALGRPCVVGCGQGVVAALVGRTVTVDGAGGVVYAGELPVTRPNEEDDPVLRTLCEWAAAHTPVKVETACNDAIILLDTEALSISDVDSLRRALARLPAGATVGGALFARDDDAVAAAVEASVATIIARPKLPVLLASVHARAASPSADSMSIPAM
jgi:pyruvate,orthophosphate dikinase